MTGEDFVFQGFELGIFEMDIRGRIWRVAHQQTNRWGHNTILVRCKARRAERVGTYLTMVLMLNGVRKCALAHRLVWRFFNGAIPAGMTINHKNGKKHDNRPANLELATHSQQTRHAIEKLGWNPVKNLNGGATL